MPLLDHFHKPASRVPWRSIHSGWIGHLAERVNTLLPPGYIALDTMSIGGGVEIDIGIEEEGDTPPPRGIRALLIFTCTAVSFAHGGNDGQKGMGLIMLILIGCAPTAYALNRTLPESAMPACQRAFWRTAASIVSGKCARTATAAPPALPGSRTKMPRPPISWMRRPSS